MVLICKKKKVTINIIQKKEEKTLYILQKFSLNELLNSLVILRPILNGLI